MEPLGGLTTISIHRRMRRADVDPRFAHRIARTCEDTSSKAHMQRYMTLRASGGLCLETPDERAASWAEFAEVSWLIGFQGSACPDLGPRPEGKGSPAAADRLALEPRPDHAPLAPGASGTFCTHESGVGHPRSAPGLDPQRTGSTYSNEALRTRLQVCAPSIKPEHKAIGASPHPHGRRPGNEHSQRIAQFFCARKSYFWSLIVISPERISPGTASISME